MSYATIKGEKFSLFNSNVQKSINNFAKKKSYMQVLKDHL